MNFFFDPRNIAVIGASPHASKGGNILVRNLRTGFDGPIYPVNPKYGIIEELTCYPSVRAIPFSVDLAIMLVPSSQVLEHLEDCIAAGVPGVIIESGGFAEGGPEGKAIQSALTRRARETGIRIWGPNCMGIVDGRKNRAFSFMTPRVLKAGIFPGDVSLVVQSGVLASTYLDDILSNGLMGISKICSIGNKADVNECDILAYLLEDPQTRVIGCYLESFAQGRRFLELCRKKGDKPIVVLQGGKSTKGAQAAMSHTASLAGNARIVSGALTQTGAVEARDFTQLIDFCRTLALIPPPSTPPPGRIAILTFSGGAGIVSADFIAAHGLETAELSETTKRVIGRLFPEWMPVNNPVDLWPAMERHAAAEVDVINQSLTAAFADPQVDAVFIHAFVGNFRIRLDLEDVARQSRETGKPVFIWLLGRRDDAFQFQNEARRLGVPAYPELGRAVACMAAVLRKR